jgi:hypothetical protein
VAPEGEFGRITLDDDTSFYLTEGQFLEFDALGRVVRHNGIVHVYRPLNKRGGYINPVRDASDSSPTGTVVD